MDFMAAVRGAGSNRRWSVVILATIPAAVAMAIAVPAQAAPNLAKAWGRNSSGQLGDGTKTGPETCTTEKVPCSLTPVAVSGLSGVTAVAGGEQFSIALLEGGTVMAWGAGGAGELGNGSNEESDVPVSVKELAGVKMIAAGEQHALALVENGTEHGTVMAWGANGEGQLGNGTTGASDVPVAVCAPEETAPCARHLTGVKAIAAGRSYSLALLETGAVVAWGANEEGQLGNGTTTATRVPVQVSGLSEGVAGIAAGGNRSLALLANEAHTLVAWGSNEVGQLGNGTTTNSVTPVAVSGLAGVQAIAAGELDSLALLSNGEVRAWGDNSDGELGDANPTGPENCGTFMLPCSKKPVAVCTERSKSEPPPACVHLTGVTAITVGNKHSLALLSDGKLMSWGENQYGQLGDGTSTGPEPCGPFATPCSPTAIEVSKASGATGIGAGGSHSLAFGPLPAVTELKPSKGSAGGGTHVGITGEDFTGTSDVKFGSTPAVSFTVISPTSISAVAPAGSAGTVDVTVTNPWGTSATSSADQYTYAVGVQELPELGRCVKLATKTGAYGGTAPHCVALSKTHKGSFEWLPGPGSSRAFEESLSAPKLETVSKKQISCTIMFVKGEYTGAKTETVSSIKVEGCEEVFHHQSCSTNANSPNGNGVIENAPGSELEGEVGFIVGGTRPQVGWDLKPKSPASSFFTFTCGPTSASTEVFALEGSVIGRASGFNSMRTSFGLRYSQSGGKQVPERFEGGVKDTLLLKTTKPGFPPSESSEQIGLKTEGSITTKESLEIKAKV